MSDTILFTLATEMLDAVGTELGTFAPERRYVTLGEVAFDCDQLVVNFLGLSTRSGEQKSCASVPQVTYGVTLVACASSQAGLYAPEADILTDYAEFHLRALWRLWSALAQLRMSGDLFGSASTIDCRYVTIGDALITGPEGGTIGITFPITIQAAK